METNFTAILLATLVTLPIGFIWYHKKVFGTVWMRETGVTEESARKANMLKVFGLTLIFSFMLAFMLPTIVIHQIGALQLTGGDPATALPSYHEFAKDYAHHYRTFKHGALHGFMAGLFIILPSIGINAQFEGKSWTYILINAGYFIVCLTLMGGIICAWE
ncbi:DUF1761 domain-containing protein [uncultured Flavobacterium sp.]|uniref:DUF1761 domain-containing protein n=1 Tax=uncultured Flavobacterium sp. TaxID=165435 RepID=UPI0025E3C4C7|nr:DUF1761 domain-containing protein [uncultured Flavobacterium sp.]